MARTSKRGDDMEKDKVVQTRISSDLKEQLKQQKDDDQTLADYIRNIIDGVVDTESRETGVNLRRGLLSDLYCIGVDHELQTNGDIIHCQSVPGLIEEHWEDLTGDTVQDEIREPIYSSSTVYIAGEGGSLGVGKWLAGRLNDQGVDTYADACEDIPLKAVGDDDTLVIISRSGTTDSIRKLADPRIQKTDATVIAVTKTGTSLAEEVDAHDNGVVLPIPTIKEGTPGPYATRAVFLQMAALYIAVLTDEPDKETIEETFTAVNSYVIGQLEFKQDGDDAEEPDWEGMPTAQGEARLSPDSPFWMAANALDQAGDLASSPLVTGIGRYHPLGRTAAHTHMGFLHTHGDHVSVGSVVESVLNVLYHGDAYLLAVVPDRDPDVADERSRYVRFWNYLSAGKESAKDLLAWPSGSPGLRLLALTFNAADKPAEEDIVKHSVYEDDGLIVLPDHGGFTNDLIVMAAHYLLVYAILDRRWERDRRLRQETMRGPTDRRI